MPIHNVLEPIIDQDTRVLILGSMPSQQSLTKQQYYGNPRNHFWPIIGEILGSDVSNDYQLKIQLLIQHRIGLWDTIQSCERQGSLDSTIKEIVPNDLSKILRIYPSIRLILFNGGKSFDVFKKYIGLDFLKDVDVDFAKMPSTSPIPGKNIKSFNEKIEEWRIIERYIS